MWIHIWYSLQNWKYTLIDIAPTIYTNTYLYKYTSYFSNKNFIRIFLVFFFSLFRIRNRYLFVYFFFVFARFWFFCVFFMIFLIRYKLMKIYHWILKLFNNINENFHCAYEFNRRRKKKLKNQQNQNRLPIHMALYGICL